MITRYDLCLAVSEYLAGRHGAVVTAQTHGAEERGIEGGRRPAKRWKEMGGDFWKGIARKAAEAGSRGTGGAEKVRWEIAGGGGERAAKDGAEKQRT